MKKINSKEQKKIMVDILKYFDTVCRDNNIKYSLIGGSLIGAIRHKGIIPWDDDIDVILTPNNYKKIIGILSKNDHPYYKLLTHEKNQKYYIPFPKLVDYRTHVEEPQLLDKIDDYGIYIDIFCYNNISNNQKESAKSIKKLKILNSMLSRKKLNFKKFGIKQNFLRLCKNSVSKIIGYQKILKWVNKLSTKYNDYETKYVISNWPIYNTQKEIQLKKNIEQYIDTKFEDINVMIFKNYDEILKTTFGDYMKLPPVEKRVSHNLEAYWKSDKNEK